MDLTHEEITNGNHSDLYLSILLKNTPEEKTAVLREYRKRISDSKKADQALSLQNEDVLTAVKNLVDSSNEMQISLSLEIENILLSELEACQQVIDKQRLSISNLEKQLIQKRENEKSVVQSVRKFKEDNQKELTKIAAAHQEEITRLSASHQEEITRLSDSYQEEIRKLSDTPQKESIPSFVLDPSPLEDEQSIESIIFEEEPKKEEPAAKPEQDLYYKLSAWPDFNNLTKGDKIIPLATRLMAQQMSFKQMEHFLGGPTQKPRLLLFIDELSATGLLTTTHTKEQSAVINEKPETNNRLQLFKRIRSSLGI
ncbi:hypothetical protein DS885_01530 [Psychromonas sp. B3M02]|uniref:hypothetical protein n=1 Tax=unclassified Psychromonas TaxID=2614957 RepID=UPI000DE90B6B|nr:hypothetical protein [Psychromonas sp. B3M02]RBW47760.1 hypothetical protein DS885_01530 [Psychromonas sp. B3M02]